MEGQVLLLQAVQLTRGNNRARHQATVSKFLTGADRRRNNAYRAEDPFGGGENNVSVGFGSAEDQFHPDDAMDE